MASAMAAYGDAASAGTRDAAQEIRMRVVEAYRQAEMAGRAVDVTERVVGVAKAREGEIQARVDTGAALQADLLRARARRREREAELAERRGQRRMAQAGLARLLGAPGRGRLRPDGGAARGRCPSRATRSPGSERRAAAEAGRSRRPAARPTPPRPSSRTRRTASCPTSACSARSGTTGSRWTTASSPGRSGSACGGRRSTRPAPSGRPRPPPSSARPSWTCERPRRTRCASRWRLAYRRAVSARERHAAASGGSEEGREAFRVVQERRKAGMATLTDELETETAALGAVLQEIGAAAEVAIADAALRRAAGEN